MACYILFSNFFTRESNILHMARVYKGFMANQLLAQAVSNCGIAQTQLAEKAGINRTTLNQWIAGRNRFNPMREEHEIALKSLAEAAGWSEETLARIMAAASDDSAHEPQETKPMYGSVALAQVMLDTIDNPMQPVAAKRDAKKVLMGWLTDYFEQNP